MKLKLTTRAKYLIARAVALIVAILPPLIVILSRYDLSGKTISIQTSLGLGGSLIVITVVGAFYKQVIATLKKTHGMVPLVSLIVLYFIMWANKAISTSIPDLMVVVRYGIIGAAISWGISTVAYILWGGEPLIERIEVERDEDGADRD